MEGGARLFHAIVMMGASLGAACGGATRTGSSPETDASRDATSGETGEGDAGPSFEGSFGGPQTDSGGLAEASSAMDGAVDAAADTSDTPGVCEEPDSDGKPCGPPCNHCFEGGCFPACFI